MKTTTIFRLFFCAPIILILVFSANACSKSQEPNAEQSSVSSEQMPATPITEVNVLGADEAGEEVKKAAVAPPTIPPVKDGVLVSEKYPDFANSILGAAILDELNTGELLRSGDIVITEAMLQEEVSELPEEIRDKSDAFGFFILDQISSEPLLFRQIRAKTGGHPDDEDWDDQIQGYIHDIISDVQTTDEELLAFYEENKNMMGDSSFEMVKEELETYLGMEKGMQAFQDHLHSLGKSVGISVQAAWVDTVATKFKDNPINNALAKGKPVFVDFYADWCGPCKLMKPTIDAIKEAYEDTLIVVEINVDEESFLARQHQAESIPTLLFYDAEGNLVSRKEGLMSEEELQKELEKIGVAPKNNDN